MNEIYLQNYFIENYLLIAMVVGMYFVVSVESAVDVFIKKIMVINMTLLLIISCLDEYIYYFHEKNLGGIGVAFVSIIYYSIKPLIMANVIKMIKRKNKFIFLPAVLNLLIYTLVYSNEILNYMDINMEYFKSSRYIYVMTDWIYWIIFLTVINLEFYKKKHRNSVAIFFCIAWIMTANVMECIDIKRGILNNAYAVFFVFYYLIVHVYISQQVNEEKDIKLREQRVLLMLSQIQPHFLYNTLNTITALCRMNPKLAEETTIKFSKYLRENIYSIGEKETHSFSEELEHTSIYLDIEKLRFGSRVNVEYDIKINNFNIPTMILQPIVENAVKHGICKKIKGGTVKISTERKGKDYLITVSDDGVGFQMDKVLADGKHHIGIKNVSERLKSKANAEMEIISLVGIGTTVRITIPGERKILMFESGERREILSIGR